MPDKNLGGNFETREEIVSAFKSKRKLFNGFKVISERKIMVGGSKSDLLKLEYINRLPLYNVNARDVLMGEETALFKNKGNFYKIEYKTVTAEFPKYNEAFYHLIKTFKFK